MIFKELSIPLFPVRGEDKQDSFLITHAVLDEDGDVIAGFGKQTEGDPHGGGREANVVLVLTKKETTEVKKFIVSKN